jgi:hypothetical protein
MIAQNCPSCCTSVLALRGATAGNASAGFSSFVLSDDRYLTKTVSFSFETVFDTEDLSHCPATTTVDGSNTFTFVPNEDESPKDPRDLSLPFVDGTASIPSSTDDPCDMTPATGSSFPQYSTVNCKVPTPCFLNPEDGKYYINKVTTKIWSKTRTGSGTGMGYYDGEGYHEGEAFTWTDTNQGTSTKIEKCGESSVETTVGSYTYDSTLTCADMDESDRNVTVEILGEPETEEDPAAGTIIYFRRSPLIDSPPYECGTETISGSPGEEGYFDLLIFAGGLVFPTEETTTVTYSDEGGSCIGQQMQTNGYSPDVSFSQIFGDSEYDVLCPDRGTITFSKTSETISGGWHEGGGDHPYTVNITGSINLSNADTYTNVVSRLNEAMSGGFAWPYPYFDGGGQLNLDDLEYANLKYYSFFGNYPSFWREDKMIGSNPPCPNPGESGFNSSSYAFGHGLPFWDHEYFKLRYHTYELDLAHAKRRFHEVRCFEGSFSLYYGQDNPLPEGKSIKFEKVTRSLWATLSTASICSAGSGGVGTTSTTDRVLEALNILAHPVDSAGSTDFAHASWSGASLKKREKTELTYKFEEADEVTLNDVFKASAFCHRNLMLLSSLEEVTVTFRVYRFNYKDAFDEFYDTGEEIDPARLLVGPIDELVAPPTFTDVTVILSETSVPGQFRSSEFGFVPDNHRQEVWVKVMEAVLTDDPSVESYLPVEIASKFRSGNMGFPQLDRMAEGGAYRGRRGFRKNTQWYSRLRYTFSRTKVSASECPTACLMLEGPSMDFATEVVFINDLDPSVNYLSSTSLEAVFKKHGWLCTFAESWLGDEGIAAPTENECTRPPVWGSFGFASSTTDTVSSSSETQTESSIYTAVISRSGLPTRNLYGSPQEDQDIVGDVWVDYEDGCGPDNGLPCSLTPKCDQSKVYSNDRYPIWGRIADPFFGYNNVLSVEEVTLPLNQSTEGYYGQVIDLEGGGFERPNEPIVATANFTMPVPASETYVTIRNFRVV